MEKKRFIVRNILRTPDGTILESRDRHDYVKYVDNVTKKDYFIDGGMSYVRASSNGDEEFLTVYSDEPFMIIREALMRGSHGKTMQDAYVRIPLKDMTIDHIEAVIAYVKEFQAPSEWVDWYVGVMNQELGWRAAEEALNQN